MFLFIRILKYVFFFLGICWALYVANAFIFLAKAFPSHPPSRQTFTTFIASFQGYLVMLGPVVLTTILLFINWPENQLKK